MDDKPVAMRVPIQALYMGPVLNKCRPLTTQPSCSHAQACLESVDGLTDFYPCRSMHRRRDRFWSRLKSHRRTEDRSSAELTGVPVGTPARYSFAVWVVAVAEEVRVAVGVAHFFPAGESLREYVWSVSHIP